MSSLPARRAAKKDKVEVRRIKARKSRIFPRALHDWYVEGEDCTTALLAVEPIEGACLDPSCGGGNVVRALLAAGLEAYGTDLVRRVPEGTGWFLGEHDFLGEQPHLLRPANIIMNPPYGKGLVAERFIRRALETATHKVCVFANDSFMGSLTRANTLFAEHPPAAVYRVVPRPSVPPGEHLLQGHKAEGGRPDFDWFVWDLQQPGRSGIGWARRKGAR